MSVDPMAAAFIVPAVGLLIMVAALVVQQFERRKPYSPSAMDQSFAVLVTGAVVALVGLIGFIAVAVVVGP